MKKENNNKKTTKVFSVESNKMITTLVNEAFTNAQYDRKKNVHVSDYFFNKDFKNCSILFAKTTDLFAKRINREAIKYLILNNDTFDGGLSSTKVRS